jgi:hypothetical protein
LSIEQLVKAFPTIIDLPNPIIERITITREAKTKVIPKKCHPITKTMVRMKRKWCQGRKVTLLSMVDRG